MCDPGQQQLRKPAEDGLVADDNLSFLMSSPNAKDQGYQQDSEYLMSGAISTGSLVSNAGETVAATQTSPGHVTNADSKMDTASTCEKIHVEPAKKAHERDWRELRHRLERKIAAAAAHAMSGRHDSGEGERRRPKWFLGTVTPQDKSKEPRLFTVNSEDKITMRGANPRTGVVSPSNHTESSQEDNVPHQACRQRWKMQGDQWICVNVSPSSSEKSRPSGTKNCCPKEQSSQVSVPDMLSDDWEDKFVVNMPSAKEPNPPTMTPEQIKEYQENIERVRLEREKMHEIGSGPNHRAGTPDAADQTMRKNPASPPSGVGQYFSPDEVGQDLVSPIQEGSHQKQKDFYDSIGDEGFVGCIEIDRPYAKNPDEILLFPNVEDDCQYSLFPWTPTSKKEGERKQGVHLNRLSAFEKAVVSEEDLPSQCTRPPLSSNQRTASAPQKSNVQASLAQRAGTITNQPSVSPPNRIPKPTATGKENQVEQANRKDDDDVFIVTPTVTRVMVPPSISKSMTEPSRLRQNQRQSPPATKFGTHVSPGRPNPQFMGPPKTTPASEYPIHHGNSVRQGPGTSSPTARYAHLAAASATQAKQGSPQGKEFTIMTESRAGPAPKNSGHLKLDTRDVFKDMPATKGPMIQDIVSPAEERARNIFRDRSSKAPSVAELDGLQIFQQMAGVPASDGPSQADQGPQKSRENVTGSGRPENSRTHSIRVEVKRAATQPDVAKPAEKRTEAKKAAERLVESRKRAERLAEAQAAYKKAEAEKGANQKTPPKSAADRLKERMIAAEKLAEAQAAYREAQAKKAAAKKAAEERADQKRTGEKAAEEKKAEKAERKTEARKSAESKASSSDPRSEGQTPENSDEHKDGLGKGEGEDAVSNGSGSSLNVQNCSLLFHIVLLSFVQLHGLARRSRIFHHLLAVSEKLFEMAGHCLRVSSRLCETWLAYRRTGSWPEPNSEELTLLMRDVGQAGVYFVVLGFVVMIVGRAAGYVVFVASWIVWFSRPFGWVFGRLGGALLA